MPAGRPTKYNDDMLAQAQQYLQYCIDVPSAVPYGEELAIKLGIDDETILEWAKIHPEFSATVKGVKRLQRQRLQGLGLHNRVNPTMAIFLLKANHGFVDIQRQEVTGKDGGPVDQNLSVTYMPDPLPDDYYAGKQTNTNGQ